MKKLFLGILLLLVAAAFYTMLTATDRASEVPVITWRTDTNPQREEQIMLFREWLVRNGHIQKDKDGKPVLYTQEEADALNALIIGLHHMVNETEIAQQFSPYMIELKSALMAADLI